MWAISSHNIRNRNQVTKSIRSIGCTVVYHSYPTEHPACSQLGAYAVLRRACPYLMLAAKPTKFCLHGTDATAAVPLTVTIIGAATSDGYPNRRQSCKVFRCFARALAFVCFTPSECQLAVGNLGLRKRRRGVNKPVLVISWGTCSLNRTILP